MQDLSSAFRAGPDSSEALSHCTDGCFIFVFRVCATCSALRKSVLFEHEEDMFVQDVVQIAKKQGFTSGEDAAFLGSQV